MILTGTCSWTEKTLIQSDEFYPKNARTAEARLKYYAEHFNTVEVDSTYYAIPNKRTTYQWADRTPDGFLFHIKVYGALTGHGIEPKTLPVELQKMLPKNDLDQKRLYIKEPHLLNAVSQYFRDALYPLMNRGKLGILLFQFPQWFQYNRENLDYILQCKELMGGLKIAVEFRHGSWLTPEHQDSVFHLLRKYQITYVTADEPQYGSLATVPFVPAVTTDIAYFRFHGRNKENWLKKMIETSLRFSYLYTDGELMEFKKTLQQVDKRAKVTYAMFNNCHGSFAVKNALKLKEELKSAD
jgi:uncharacterized protein YecE (DUF72 family)